MKKLVILVLLVPMLALTMISCDADMRSNLAGWMGGFNGNVYADAGFIVPNTAQAEAAAATIATIGTGDGAKTVTAGSSSNTLGVSITVPTGVTKVLAPQSEAEQTELKENLGDAFNSDTQKEQLLEDLKTEVVAGSTQQIAAQGTVLVFNATLDQIKIDLGGDSSELGKTLEKLKLPEIADGDNLTQGDLLALQLMTDLISNTVATLTEIGGTLAGATDAVLDDPANKDKVLSIIDDALFAAEVAEQISGAASIDFTGQIDLGSLMDGLGDDKGTRSSGEPIELTDAEDFIGTINALAPSIVELMGITYNGTVFSYEPKTYKSFLLNQQIYRSSMEQAMKMMELGGLAKKDIDSLTFDTSTLVKYALAVFVTEHHAFWKSEEKAALDLDSNATVTPVNVVITTYLNHSQGNKNLGLGELVSTDKLTQPLAGDFTNFDYDNWPTFLKTAPRDKAYFEAIINNIIEVNKAGGIAQLTEELEKFRDAGATEDGLTKWFNEL